MRWILVCVGFAWCTLSTLAQPKLESKSGDALIEKILAAEVAKLNQKFLDGAKTRSEWQEKRPRLTREYYDMLGLWPIPEKTPLKATVTRTFENQGAIIENLHYQSRPGLYVTANFYRPKSPPAAKLPTILYVCGHSDRGRDGNKSAFQDHGLWFANNGYNCLIVDTLQLGEIPGIHHGTYGLRGTKAAEAPTRMWWHSAGYTPAGVECWNGVRGIDYLLTRPEVDPDKIGVTGISGGGAATIWIAAADDRVKVAVPVSGMADLECYVRQRIINGHCDCMFLYNTYQWEWTTIAARIAPRPMLFANSDKDSIFPMSANRRIIERLRKVYAMYEKPDLVDEYVSVGGHDYRPDLRVAIFRFINKHLKGDATSAVADAKFDKIEGKDLRVFPTDDDLPRDRINGTVDEVFTHQANDPLPTKESFSKWRAEQTELLRSRIFHSIPTKLSTWSKSFGPGSFLFGVDPESDERIVGGIHAPSIDGNGATATLEVVSERNEQRSKRIASNELVDLHKMKLPAGARGRLIPRLQAMPDWTEKSPPNFVRRAHVLLGSTVDGTQVTDAVVGFRQAQRLLPQSFAEKREFTSWQIVGQAEDAMIAAFAAIFEPSIDQITLVKPPTTFRSPPYFLGIQKYIALPDALGLLAPRPLTIIGDDPVFDRTAEIYRLAGAEDKLTRIKK